MTEANDSNYNEYVKEHEKVLWTRFILIFLGLWLFFVPIGFDYYTTSNIVFINDMACGVAVVLCAMFAFSPTSKFFPLPTGHYRDLAELRPTCVLGASANYVSK